MKDFRKNKQAFKRVCLLAIIVLTLFIHLFFHISSLFSKSLRQLTMGQKKKKKRIQGGGERQKGKQEASIEWNQW